MSVVRVLRAVNAQMKERMPELVTEIGNQRASVPGCQRLIWKLIGGPRAGGIQVDDGATVLDVREVTVVAEIRVKRPDFGVTEDDYEAAEEVLRHLEIALRRVASADFRPGAEVWPMSDEPEDAGAVVQVPISFSVKVLDDPWVKVVPAEDPEAQGFLNDETTRTG